ncbi:MAG: fibronectin type III domain-containing protein, partial [Bacteroidales bacterium]|nr:fibronectin type III domain-containing protein [Bacteroidales bacterium]
PSAPDYNHAFYRWYNNTIEVIWGDNSNNEEGFYVLDSIDGVNGWAIIGQTGANVDRIDIPSTMNDCEMHYIAVVAFNQAGTSAKSRIVEVEPPCEISAPSNLTETIDDLEVTLNWSDNAENETGYRVYRVHDDGYWMWTEKVTDLPANTTSFTFDGELCSYNSYNVVALYNNFESNSTNNVFFQLRCDIESPTDLTLVEVTETTATISWTDNSDNEDGFAIQNCLKGGCSGMVFADANQTEITIELDPNEIYGYSVQVVATKDDRHSFESNNISFYPPVYAPTQLAITSQSATTVDLVWEDNSEVENTYDIYRSTNGIDFEYLKSADANATSITAELNTQESTNYFQVRATSWASSSEPSNTVNIPPQSESQFKTAIASTQSKQIFDVVIAPSVVQTNAKVVYSGSMNSNSIIEVINIAGTKIFETSISPTMEGQQIYILDAADYETGSYILRVTSVKESEVLSKSVRFIKN